MNNDGIAWGFALRATTPQVAQSILNGQNTINPKSAFQNLKFAF
ncbi:hypothetical protein D1AOALGA4SA_2777 [Olavius algarvensis Delta 1 endosymbiont]|nr:hypothetical protein D1AOALGA4SA_2777 [Olavius algarvensis Delta 1 endosymbiont]